MNKKLLLSILSLILCIAVSFGVESMLPHTYTQKLEEVNGLVVDGDEEKIIYRLQGGVSDGEEDYDDEEYFEDEAYYEDEEYYEDEAYYEEYEEENSVAQLSFDIKENASFVELTFYGYEGCEVLASTPDGETEYYVEMTGTQTLVIPVKTDNSQVTVQFTDSQTQIQKIQVKMNEGFNSARFMVIVLTLSAFVMLALHRNFIADHIEYGFLIVALVVVSLFAVLTPQSMWWDEEIHYNTASDIATTASEMAMGKTFNEVLTEVGIHMPNYLATAIGIVLSNLFNLSKEASLIVERAMNGLMYISVCFLAIRWVKRYKRSFTFIALMPLALFLSVSYSYDVSINAFTLLGIALLINEFCTPYEKLQVKNAFLITLSLVIVGLPKAVYTPILLLMLLLPKTKFQCKKQHIAYKIGIVLVVLMVFAAYLMPMISNPDVYIDNRGSGESSMSKFSIILGDLGGFISLVVRHMWNDFVINLQTARNFLAYLGGGSNTLNLLSSLFMIYVFATDNDKNVKVGHPTLLQKSGMAVIGLGIMAMIYVVFYVAFSESATSVISGVQGRYFFPLFPLLAVVIQSKNVVNGMKNKNFNFCVLAISLITNIVLIWQLILNPFYM